jgi:hypothetical protein
MYYIRWDEFFGSLYERFLYIDAYDIATELFTLYGSRRTPQKWIVDPASFFGISLDKVIGDLRDEVPVIEVRPLTSLGSLWYDPEAIHIEIYFFPFFEIEIIVCRHRWYRVIFVYSIYFPHFSNTKNPPLS